jgi:hypothetical protein
MIAKRALPTSPCKGEIDREASCACSCVAQREDVDARHKAGHDGHEAVL